MAIVRHLTADTKLFIEESVGLPSPMSGLEADGTRVWSLMQLERQLRPEAYGWRRGGYIDRRRTQPGSTDPRMRWLVPDVAQGAACAGSRCVTAGRGRWRVRVGCW
jgi:hypothetical protein